MVCIIVWWSDRSGVVMVMGPWRTETEAILAKDGLEPFSEGKIFEIRPMASVILPKTVE